MLILTFCDEKVEHRKRDGVPAEHVIPTRSYALYAHACASPDDIGVRHFCGQVAEQRGTFLGRIVTRLTLKMGTGDAQRRYQHRDASEEEYCTGKGEESSHQYESGGRNIFFTGFVFGGQKMRVRHWVGV